MISFISIRNNSLAYYYTLQFYTILFTNRASYRLYTQKESRQRQTLCYYNYRKSYATSFCISIKATKCILTQCMTRSLLPLATFKKSILYYKSTYVQQFLYYESHSSYPNTVQKDCTVVQSASTRGRNGEEGIWSFWNFTVVLPAKFYWLSGMKSRETDAASSQIRIQTPLTVVTTFDGFATERRRFRGEQNEDVGNSKYRVDRVNRMPPVSDSYRFRAISLFIPSFFLFLFFTDARPRPVGIISTLTSYAHVAATWKSRAKRTAAEPANTLPSPSIVNLHQQITVNTSRRPIGSRWSDSRVPILDASWTLFSISTLFSLSTWWPFMICFFP